jgi:hypothetical protein
VAQARKESGLTLPFLLPGALNVRLGGLRVLVAQDAAR